MRVTRVKLEYSAGEVFHLTPLSDLHLDTRDCDIAALRRLIKERSALPNHRFIGLGDFADWVLPSDRKRHRPSNVIPKIAGADDIYSATIDYQASVLPPCDLLTVGNHEATVIKHGYHDPIAELCTRLNAAYGGYSGFLQYVMCRKGARSSTIFSILYSHGAWHGNAAIPPGVHTFCAAFEGWDIFLFGHNHRYAKEHRTKLRAPRAGAEAVSRDVVICAAGTSLRGYQHAPGRAPGYSEMRCHQPTTIATPLITWQVVRHSGERKRGKPHTSVKFTVT